LYFDTGGAYAVEPTATVTTTTTAKERGEDIDPEIEMIDNIPPIPTTTTTARRNMIEISDEIEIPSSLAREVETSPEPFSIPESPIHETRVEVGSSAFFQRRQESGPWNMQRGRANPFQYHSHAATSAAQDKLALLFSPPQDIMFRGHYDSVS